MLKVHTGPSVVVGARQQRKAKRTPSREELLGCYTHTYPCAPRYGRRCVTSQQSRRAHLGRWTGVHSIPGNEELDVTGKTIIENTTTTTTVNTYRQHSISTGIAQMQMHAGATA